MEEGEGIIIFPVWPVTQPWYPKLMSLLVDTPRLLPVPSKQTQSSTSHGGQTETNCMQVIRESLTKQSISAEATEIILMIRSRRKDTSKQYQSYYKKWFEFFHREQISTVRPSLAQVTEFLLTLFHKGLSNASLYISLGCKPSSRLLKDFVPC